MDAYDTTLPTAERDRRERVGADVHAALITARAARSAAKQLVKRVAADSPVCDPVCDYFAKLDEIVGDLEWELMKVEYARYYEKQHPTQE